MNLRKWYEDVRDVRAANADVFKTPSDKWCLLFTHEEVTELTRVVARESGNDFLRGNTMVGELDTAKHLEWGQAMMMLLSFGLARNVRPGTMDNISLDVLVDEAADELQESIEDNLLRLHGALNGALRIGYDFILALRLLLVLAILLNIDCDRAVRMALDTVKQRSEFKRLALAQADNGRGALR